MKGDISDIKNLSEQEFDLFRESVNALFTGTFLVRGLDKDRKLYRFVIANLDLFQVYFSYAGWDLRVDETLGIVTWFGPPAARLNLTLDESMSLLIMRLLYEEKRNDISLQEYPAVRQQEFQDKYRIITEDSLKKTRLKELLRRFQTLKLIKIQGDETDPEALLILYPSIAFAIDAPGIDDIYAKIEALSDSAPEEEADNAESVIDASAEVV